ncbi:hypothetical protein K3495_g585 [Podosphaera aphanis]|nr:hypothetical protein K3495_g585 [Podosphaera aphanis]
MTISPLPLSDRRSSIMWKEDTFDYKTLTMSLAPETKKSSHEVPKLSDSDPYELYLSSEEDASISDYDNECLFDSDDSEVDETDEHSRTSTRSSIRTSREITARAISFRVVGRPQIIEINHHSTPNQNSLFPAGLKMKTDSTSKNTLAMKPLPLLTLSKDSIHEERSRSPLSLLSSTPAVSPLSENPSTPTPLIQSNLSFYEELALFSTELSQPWMPLSEFSLSESDKSVNQDSSLNSPGLLSASHAPKVSARSSSRSAVAALRRVSRSFHVPKISLAYTPGVTSPRSPSYQGKNLSPLSTPDCEKPLPQITDTTDRIADNRAEGTTSPTGHALPKIRTERRISLGYSKKLTK